ncbi:MAG: 30S ribosomal protein S9 [Chloroflexi bacterium]|nr:30S ribosomal protein S9 [Chloroflexota bacterium]
MGTIDIVVILLLLVAVATAIVSCIVVFGNRRNAQSRLDEAKTKVEEEERQSTKEDRKKRKIPLSHIPPRRQPQPQELSEKRSPQESKQRRPKPEFVCWNKERQWIVGVEVPGDFLELPGLQVLQNGSPLPRDESREACWCLEKIYDEVVVRCVEGEDVQEIEVAHGQEGYLLFKLSGQNQNEGRRVKSPSLEWHLVITPENWDRDEALSGPPRVTKQSVSINGYDAHFFINERDSDKKIAFLKPTGESVIIESKTSRFGLVGHRLNDASEDIGPLFGERSPKIRGSDRDAWKDVGTIVVGEEGSGKGRWRKAFCPVPENGEQDLPPEVAVRKDGWYFLRFYDTNDDFIESLDFRVVSALRDIKILQSSPFPSDGEHESARIELHHESGCAIQPADDLARNIQIEEKNNRTTLTIPPDSTYDETRWLIGSTSAPQVQVTLLVERLWWAIDKEDNPPSEWEDELLTLTSDDFTATTNQALWLRLPMRRWANRVLVGFERSRARPYPVKVAEREIAIPLREFGDCQEMGEQARDHFLTIWIERDQESIEGSVAIVPASMGPILCIGWGRKKRAIATVVLREGDGAIKVNGRVADDYFARTPGRARQFLRRLVELPDISSILSQLDVSIEVRGSSPNTVQQVKASTHGLARTLMKYDPHLNPLLTQAGFGGVKVTERFGVQTGR